MEFEKILRDLMEKKDLTQIKLAKALKLERSTLGNYVQGTREPDLKTLIDIADYFNVSTDYLLDHRAGKGESHNEDELLRIFRALSPIYQDTFLKIGNLFITQSDLSENEIKLRIAESIVKYKKDGAK